MKQTNNQQSINPSTSIVLENIQQNSSYIVKKIDERRLGKQLKKWKNEVQHWLELRCILKHDAEYMDLPITTKSTIALDFSANGQYFASTHGDHTVKITLFSTGEIVQTLEGHPRTPWTVKYHPTNNFIVASGCLGFQVRVWDTKSGVCLHTTICNHAIISMSFHPSGAALAIASGATLFLWAYEDGTMPPQEAWQHSQPLRCVRFLPCGKKVLVGAANIFQGRAGYTPTPRDASFQLLLWHFNMEAILNPSSPCLTQPRCILKRALLYNDGGLDLSPCGKYLFTCAEFWVAGAWPGPIPFNHLQTVQQIQQPPGPAPQEQESANSLGTYTSESLRAHLSWRRQQMQQRASQEEFTRVLEELERKSQTQSNNEEQETVNRRNSLGTYSPGSLRAHLLRRRQEMQQRVSGLERKSQTQSNTEGLLTPGLSSPVTEMNLGSSEVEEEPKTTNDSFFISDSLKSIPSAVTPPSQKPRKFIWPQRYSQRPKADGTMQNVSPQDQGATDLLRNRRKKRAVRDNSNLVISPRDEQHREACEEKASRGDRPTPFYNKGNTTRRRRAKMEIAYDNSHKVSVKSSSPNTPPEPPDRVSEGPHIKWNLARAELSNSTQLREGVGLPLQEQMLGLYQAHLVQVCLDDWDDEPLEPDEQMPGPTLDSHGHIVRHCTLSGFNPKGITSVKLSPAARYLLLGCGVRDQLRAGHSLRRQFSTSRFPVTYIFDAQAMVLVDAKYEEEDDVNIARFHPHSGEGYMYGTKQGRIRLIRSRK